MNWELPDIQAGFRKGRENGDPIVNIYWITGKAREFQKNLYFCFTDYAKAFDCVDHYTLRKIQKEMGIPNHLTCLLRNLYAGQEATVRTRHGTMDWFQIGKRICQGWILLPCLFNLYAEYIMQNARLDEAEARLNIAGRKGRRTKEALDESERGEWNIWLKLLIQKMNIMAFGPITSWQIDGDTMETDRPYFLGLHNHCREWLQPWN